MVINRGNFPNSPLHATFVAFLLTPKYSLQNLEWTFSVSDWSHLLRSLLMNAPHTSELYRSIGEIILSKILIASFGFSDNNYPQ